MEFEIKEYVKMFKKRWWLITGLVLTVTLITGIISFFFIQPVYSASTKLIVNKSSQYEGFEILDYNAINTNLMLINTYKEIIRTPAIMEKVSGANPDLGLSAEELIGLVKVTSLADTQVMTITAVHEDYKKAVKITNSVSEVFKKEIPAIMKVDNVTILHEAKDSDLPVLVKPNKKLNLAIAFILSLIGSLGLIVLLEYFDDSIKTEKDVEKYLGVPTVAVIDKIKTADVKNEAPTKPKQKAVGDTIYASANQ